MNAEQIFDDLLTLYKSYYEVHRRTVSLDRYNETTARSFEFEPTDPILRESLLEHVGSLPIVATYLYPYLEHREKIDLGRVLQMLAIHDIGEVVVGDEHPYRKTDKFIDSESKAALDLLPTQYHELYVEYDTRETYDAKYAKAADMFSTFLVDQLLPKEFVAKRHKANDFTWKGYDERRYSTFEWDAFLLKLFEVVVMRYQQIGT